MKNCIFYETEFDNRISNGDNSNYKIKNIKVLKEKIKSVLENKTFAKELFFNYYNLIKNFHTRSKRALYILNIISNVQK
jgi:ribosomal protein L19E